MSHTTGKFDKPWASLNDSEAYTYIEIVTGETVVHRIDVTGKSNRSIERAEDGVNINLAPTHYTRIASYQQPQQLNP